MIPVVEGREAANRLKQVLDCRRADMGGSRYYEYIETAARSIF